MKKELRFTEYDITAAVGTILLAAKQNYKGITVSVIANDYTDMVKFILSSALLSRYKAPQPKVTVLTQTTEISDENINLAVSLIGNFDEEQYKKLPLVLQHFVYFSSNVNALPVGATTIITHWLTYPGYEVIDILLNNGATVGPKQSKVKDSLTCPMCGSRTANEGICSVCYDKLLSTINFRVEDFKLYGSSLRDFRTQVKNYDVQVIDKLFTFTRTSHTESMYEPMLPFEEYQNNTAIL